MARRVTLTCDKCKFVVDELVEVKLSARFFEFNSPSHVVTEEWCRRCTDKISALTSKKEVRQPEDKELTLDDLVSSIIERELMNRNLI